MTRVVMVVVIATWLCAPVAAGGPGTAWYEDLDGNGDGLVSRDELVTRGVLISDFNARDVDRDGQLSAAELVHAAPRTTRVLTAHPQTSTPTPSP